MGSSCNKQTGTVNPAGQPVVGEGKHGQVSSQIPAQDTEAGINPPETKNKITEETPDILSNKNSVHDGNVNTSPEGKQAANDDILEEDEKSKKTESVSQQVSDGGQDVPTDVKVDSGNIDDVSAAETVKTGGDHHAHFSPAETHTQPARSSKEIKMNAIGELGITKPAPEFEAAAVVNGQFQTVKLSDYRGKYVVFFFYPLDFTFVCPTEIIAFSDRAEDFQAIGCEVLACSTDSVYSHLAWVNTPRKMGGLGPMKVPLIADKTLEISKKYGCFKEDEGVAFRGLYIIDDKGNLRQITINDLPVGRSVDETLRLVQAFQFTDKYGEVCPAGWKPGKDTMKPEPSASKEYFGKAH